MTGTYKMVQTDGEYIVYEKGFPLGKSKDKTKARKFMNHLKYGGAFEGRTPDFMLRGGASDLDARGDAQ